MSPFCLIFLQTFNSLLYKRTPESSPQLTQVHLTTIFPRACSPVWKVNCNGEYFRPGGKYCHANLHRGIFQLTGLLASVSLLWGGMFLWICKYFTPRQKRSFRTQSRFRSHSGVSVRINHNFETDVQQEENLYVRFCFLSTAFGSNILHLICEWLQVKYVFLSCKKFKQLLD